MVVGYYKEIYCALDIDIENIINFLKDYLDNSDVECDCAVDKCNVILDNLDDWLDYYLMEQYPEIEDSKQYVLNQIRGYLQENLMNYL